MRVASLAVGVARNSKVTWPQRSVRPSFQQLAWVAITEIVPKVQIGLPYFRQRQASQNQSTAMTTWSATPHHCICITSVAAAADKDCHQGAKSYQQ